MLLKSSRQNRLIVFDFDGTLVDSFDMHFELMGRALLRYKKYKVTKKEYLEAFNVNPWHYWIKKLKLNKIQTFILVYFVGKETRKNYPKAEFFPGIVDVILKLSKNNSLAIVSSTPKKSIVGKLKEAKLDKYFKIILGAEAGLSKVKKFNKLKKKYSDLVFITDTVGDVREAKACGLKTGAVAWGWHSLSKLKNATPDYVFKKPSDIKSLFG